MAQEFKMPDIGEGLTEGEIGKWLVEEGQTIKENDPLVEVLTEKVNVEIPSPFGGTVLELLAEEGDIVDVGTAIVVIGKKGEKGAKGKKGKGKPKEEEPPVDEELPKEKKEGKKAKSKEEPAKKPAPSGRILATPAVRRLARELEVEIKEVSGTGDRGRITEDDVRAFAEGGPPVEAEAGEEAPVEEVAVEEPAEEPPAEEAPPEEPLPAPVPVEAGPPPPEQRGARGKIRGIRRTISERMLQSKNTAAHFTYVEEVDVTELVSLRKRVKGWAEDRGVRLTYLPFILKALVAALKENPTLNASVDWENEEVLVKRYYNIGIATATDAGLLVPVIQGVDQKSVLTVAKEVDALSEKARAGNLTLEDIHDPTFTVTSLGVIGGVLATPIIHHPQLAILGVHKIAKRPMVQDGQVVIREMMNVSVSFDHRIIDGHVGAAFTQSLVRYLEDPGVLLLHLLEAEGNGP
ncbi:MAG: dihydrolipoamide acetyltransferase family protein [Thermoplasmata archaeon]